MKHSLPILFALLSATGRLVAQEVQESVMEAPARCLVDAPIAAHQVALLELASRAASALPLTPHVKDRSRAQERVVAACLELDQPRHALAYVEGIENWRRGAGYADLGIHCAEHGLAEDAQSFLDLATGVAEAPLDETDQQWRRDRIRAKIARAYVLLGELEVARSIEERLVDSEQGRVAAARARAANDEELEAQLQGLAAIIASGDFEQVRAALFSCAELYDRYFADEERRGRVEEIFLARWDVLPVSTRIDLSMVLARYELGHEAQAEAGARLDEVKEILGGGNWSPDYESTVLAQVAELRFCSGEAEQARAEVDRALAVFQAGRDRIAGMFRAAALRPIAEAYQVMGARKKALAAYWRAVDEGADNPNGRPRALDLSATCLSMARVGFRPDDALWSRLRAISAGLTAPW